MTTDAIPSPLRKIPQPSGVAQPIVPAMRDARTVLSRLGVEVRSRRKQRGWSRRVLAERTGISERFLADVESGKANPSVGTLCDVASAFEIDATELLGARFDAAQNNQRIVLLGLRGAGKSSVARSLAASLGWPVIELDAEVERSAGMKVGQIFELNGEPFFRRLEREALRKVLDSGPNPCIIATGGGIVTEPETLALIQLRTWSVWLRAKPEDHWARVVAQGDTRPMKNSETAFEGLVSILRERERLYRQAHVIVDTSGREIGAIAQDVLGAWKREHA